MLKNLPKMFLGIYQNFSLLCSNMNNIDVKILLLECSIRVFTIRFDSNYALQHSECSIGVYLAV